MMDWKQFAEQILVDLSRMSPSDEIAWTNLVEKLRSSGVKAVSKDSVREATFSNREEKIKYVLGQILFQLTNGSHQGLLFVHQSLNNNLNGNE